jgi:hypothetical protein
MDDLGYESTTLRQLADDFAKSYRGEAICIYETKKTRMHGLVPLVSVPSTVIVPILISVPSAVGRKSILGDYDRQEKSST